jgi:hypothetical protein
MPNKSLAEMLLMVLTNKKIHREEWPPDVYVGLLDGKLLIRMEDKLYHPWTISVDDLIADDWVIYTN